MCAIVKLVQIFILARLPPSLLQCQIALWTCKHLISLALTRLTDSLPPFSQENPEEDKFYTTGYIFERFRRSCLSNPFQNSKLRCTCFYTKPTLNRILNKTFFIYLSNNTMPPKFLSRMDRFYSSRNSSGKSSRWSLKERSVLLKRRSVTNSIPSLPFSSNEREKK